MKMSALVLALVGIIGVAASPLFAGSSPEPTVYVVQKGDTLWDITDRFFKDPFYWPNLWSRNPAIGNPHFIYPGQKLRILSDRIEVVSAPPPAVAGAGSFPAVTSEPVREKTFRVTGGEGFITEHDLDGVGRIVATNHDRVVVGSGDQVYTNIGTGLGARRGDRFSIFSKQEVITHPARHVTVGYKIVPLGTLELTDLTPSGSRAMVTESFREISSGSLLLPRREVRREIPLKASRSSLSGIILDSLTGNKINGVGDVLFLDLGNRQGLEVGNMLYVVRQPVPEREYRSSVVLPLEVIGALVVIDAGRDASTALVVKNIETIYLGDTVVTLLPE